MAAMVVTHTEPRRKPPVCLTDGQARRARAAERGQASVEFVALLPILLLVVLAMAQASVAGWTAWSAGGAARVAARAQALGQNPQKAVRRALPAMLARHSSVTIGRRERDRGVARVRLVIPELIPGLHLGGVSSRAQLPEQTG